MRKVFVRAGISAKEKQRWEEPLSRQPSLSSELQVPVKDPDSQNKMVST